MTTPEFSRPERLDAIGERPRTITIAATADECAALATRFDLLAVGELGATLSIAREPRGIAVRGTVSAEITQACVATGAAVPARIAEDISLRYVDVDADGEDEIELSEDDCDLMPIEGNAIDLGEAAAETMALALDPFPRAPDADAALRAAGVLSEEEAKPAGALAGLRAALEGKS